MIRPAEPSGKGPDRPGAEPRRGLSTGHGMFSNTTEYALRAAVHVASLRGGSASSERVAEATKVPAGYISKVMRDLVVAGIVTSQRGPKGGFTLARAPESITVLDVVNAVTPIHRITSCPLGHPGHLNLCPLHRRLDDAIAGIERAFSDTTLAEIIDSDDPAGPTSSAPRCSALTIDRTPVDLPLRGAGRRAPRSR